MLPVQPMLPTNLYRASICALVVASSGAIAAQQAQSPVPGPQVTEVYSSGEAGYHSFRIPSVIATQKGTLLAFAEARRTGASDAGRTVGVMKTIDDGVTWSTPVEITTSVKKPDWTWYATGPGVGIETSGGRLVIPGNHAEAGSGIHRSHIVFSDYGGQHWSLGASSDAGTNESQIAELADGRLMLNMRNHPPKPENFRMVAK